MFNWFRRKFGQDSATETAQEQQTAPETPQPEEEAAAPEPELETPATSEAKTTDYLSWAKTAYQKIQQRQEPETPPTAAAAPLPPTTEEIAVADTETTATEATPAADTGKAEPETLAEEPEPAPPTPPWMQKSDRLEILKETAIEAAEPAAEPTAPAAQLPFDEEFVWSAKVLAQEGRSAEDIAAEEISWLKRLRQGLGKTRRSLVNQLKAIVGQGPLNQDAVMEIEALLLQADVGIEATDYIIETLQDKMRQGALPSEVAIEYLKTILREILDRPLQQLATTDFAPAQDTLNIWLLAGVNGAGKTTTIGKLAHMANQSGYRCLIAAADTFRAAAVEQVKVWGERSGTPVIANPGKNTDPAAVVFDGIAAAHSRQADLLLVDTAGRLQNKKNLMEELSKIRRIIDKKAPEAKVESLLVLDATLGQNGLRQAQVFSEAAKLSGVVLTKLDGTAKGGVALAVAQQLNLPIRFIGAGEGIEDLRPFSSYEFVEALLSG